MFCLLDHSCGMLWGRKHCTILSISISCWCSSFAAEVLADPTAAAAESAGNTANDPTITTVAEPTSTTVDPTAAAAAAAALHPANPTGVSWWKLGLVGYLKLGNWVAWKLAQGHMQWGLFLATKFTRYFHVERTCSRWKLNTDFTEIWER